MAQASNERVGTLTARGTGYRLNLAADRQAPYRPSYRTVWPEYQDVPGSEGKVAGDPTVRQWHITEWGAGEGEDLWKQGSYNESENVRPKPVGDGLVLGALRELTVNDNATPATFVDCDRFGFGLGKLWACEDATVHEWQPTTSDWDETGTATGSVNKATSIVDAMDGTNLLIGTGANEIEKVDPGGANSTLETGLGYDPVLVNFGATVYCLVGDDLYTVDAAAGLSGTAVSDISGQSDDYLTGTPTSTWNRLSVSDKGPIWLQRLDSGQTYIWEYNEADDTTTRVGKLPVEFAYPYSIMWAFGFIFVGYRDAGTNVEDGEAHVYFQRGQQQGTTGQIRGVGGSQSQEPIWLAGIIGDDLIFYYDKAIWGYNLTEGGISQIGQSGTSNTTGIRDAITFGKDVFISNVNAASNAERFDTKKYSKDTATLDTGRFDFGYLGVDKILLQTKIITDPLPANTSVTLKQSANGAAFTAVTGTHNVDDATSYLWTVSTSTTSITGEDFELQVGMCTTDSDVTPTVRAVSSRAVAGEKQRSWVLELDVGTFASGRGGYADRSADLLAAFRSWCEHQGVVSFSNPWDVEGHDAAVDYECLVERAVLVESEAEGDPFLQVQLREAVYV